MVKALVTWSREYNLGVEAIDKQHESLVELVNQVWESIVFRVDKAKVLEIIEQLELYTVAHFAAEEAYMQSIGYPQFEEHKRIHEIFVAKVIAEKQKAIGGGQLTLGLVNFLKQWLLDHILGEDKMFAQYAKQMQVAAENPHQSAHKQEEKPDSLLTRIFRKFVTLTP